MDARRTPRRTLPSPAAPAGAAALAVAFAAALFLPTPARAAGLLIADGGLGGRLEIEEQSVRVTLNNGIAVTEVTQVFRNLEDRQVEALYTFPVPESASVSNFSMWIDGKEMVGEVLEKRKARQIYDSYKRRRVDPGLLEQADYKTFEMRIFPINPRAEQRVRITYYQELDHDDDRVTWVYPLATVAHESIDSRTKGAFTLTVDVKSEVPIASIESPSHEADFVFARHSDTYRQASLEVREGDLNRDVVLSYELARPKTGLDVVTSREEGEDGYFCLMLTAGEDLEAFDTGMDYVFVLDISGSMAHGNKMRLSRGSISAFVDALGQDDRFDLVTFNIAPQSLFGQLEAANDETRSRAGDYLRAQRPRGGTSLTEAMQSAYRYGEPDRQLNVVVLSDGMTSNDERAIMAELIRKRPQNARVFCIGVGNEVNRPLLEQLAEESGGIASFISRGDNFARQAKAFRRKLTRPAASNLAIEFEGGSVYDVEPRRLPDLYHGAPVRIFGRYRDDGPVTVEIRADIAGRAFEQNVEITLPELDADNPEIERMWASKRIDRLLKEADASGSRDAVIDEIVRLGETFSIVSEYTSFLVLENDAEYQRWKIERRNLRRVERDTRARERVAQQLAAMREKAVAGIGPEAVEDVATATPPAAQAPASTPQTPAPRRARPEARPTAQPAPSPAPDRPRRGIDLDFGGGPVGPLFVAAAAWLARRKRRTAASAA